MKRPLIVFLLVFYGWKFATSEDSSTVDCALFKVRTEDTSESCGYKDNDTSKYNYVLKGLLKNQPLYTFNSGVKFVALLYNDEFVWKHTSSHDSSKYPTELEIDPYNNTLWVKYGVMDFLTFKFENNKWKHSHDLSYGDCKRVTIPDYNDPSAASTPVSPPAEVKAEEKVEEEEAEKAEDAKEEAAEVEKPEETTKVEAEEKPAGESEAGKEATEAGGAEPLVGTSGESATEEKGEQALGPLERSKVTVHTLDDSGNSHENNTAQYTVTEENGLLQVEFVDTAKLHKVDYDGVTVWSESQHPCKGYPKVLYVNLKDNVLWVQSEDKIHTFQRFKNGWEVVESENESQVLKGPAKEAAAEVVAEAYADASTVAAPAGGDDAGLAAPATVAVSELAAPATAVEANEHEDAAKADADSTPVAHEAEAASTDDDAEKAEPAKEDDAKEGGEGLTASAEAGAPAEGDKTSPGDLLLTNLFPSDYTGAYYGALTAVAQEAAPVSTPAHGAVPAAPAEGGKAPGDDVLLSNLYPADYAGSVYCGLRGTELDEEVKAKEAEPGLSTEETDAASTDADAEKAEPSKEEAEKAAPATVAVSELAAPASEDPGKSESSTAEVTDASASHVASEEAEKAEPAKEEAEKASTDADATTPVAQEADTSGSHVASEEADKAGAAAVKKLEHNGKHLKVFTLADDGVSLEEDKDGKFEVEVEDNKVAVGKFNAGAKCVKLEYEGKEVWKHEESKHGTKHPSEVRFNTDNLEVVLAFEEDKSKFTFKHDSKSNAHVLAHSFLPLDVSQRPDKVKFYKDAAAAEEIGDADLSLSKEGDGKATFLVHRFNSGAKCHWVKYDGKDVWEYDEEYGENYPASVHYNTEDHELRVFVRDNWYYFYKYDDNKKEHDVYREKEPADYASK